MELGDPTATTHAPRSRLDEALDTFDAALTELIGTIDTGALDHLSAEEKVAVWQRFETLRNRQPLIDHQLIADAEAHHLSEEYCSSTMTHFLVRVLQLSPGDAATRVRAAAAVGPRTTMLGEKLEPALPQLAALQRDGAVSAEKVAIVERAMHKLARPDLDPEAVETAEQLLAEHAAILAPPELRRFAHAVVNAADPDGPQPVDETLASNASTTNTNSTTDADGNERPLQHDHHAHWVGKADEPCPEEQPRSHDGVLGVGAVERNSRRRLWADAHRHLDLVLAGMRSGAAMGGPRLTLQELRAA